MDYPSFLLDVLNSWLKTFAVQIKLTVKQVHAEVAMFKQQNATGDRNAMRFFFYYCLAFMPHAVLSCDLEKQS